MVRYHGQHLWFGRARRGASSYNMLPNKLWQGITEIDPMSLVVVGHKMSIRMIGKRPPENRERASRTSARLRGLPSLRPVKPGSCLFYSPIHLSANRFPGPKCRITWNLHNETAQNQFAVFRPNWYDSSCIHPNRLTQAGLSHLPRWYPVARIIP